MSGHFPITPLKASKLSHNNPINSREHQNRLPESDALENSRPVSRCVPTRIIALLMLITALPLMLIVAVLVRVTSPGPIIYRQWRLGLNGKPFQLYKFRTMRVDAEADTGPVWASKYDPRVTPIGGVLRKLGLDELPQLVNVIRGDMTLVGPRPERPEIARALASDIPNYMDRLYVRPGITGLAQINLAADTDLDSVRRKLILDLEYISSRNLWIDACIVCSTMPRLIGSRGASVVHLLGLARDPELLSTDEESSDQYWGDDSSAGMGLEQLAFRESNSR